MTYSPPFFLFNGHLETIYPALFRKIRPLAYQHERITTPDEDFLDLYWLTQNSGKLVILSHGLEGNALRPYMNGMARACYQHGFDVLAWNFRGCGDEMNKQLRFYHSGATDDLELVIQHALKKAYREINLIGFSLGGNLTLKYLGESQPVHHLIHRAVTFSVPLDLLTSCHKISAPANRLYAYRFLRSLKNKVMRKAQQMKVIRTDGLETIRTLMEFDDRYTAPLHGFENAEHYYKMCSAINYVQNIRVPTLIINAKNDPFLSIDCFPEKLLENHAHVKFACTEKGGHVGFSQFDKNGLYWSEERAVEFLAGSYTQNRGTK